jgi:glucose-1-phosphate thymidylyltransferase
VITNSIVGPHVSIGTGSKVNDAVLKNSIIQANTKLSNTIIANSMIGEGAEVKGKALDISMSDYTTLSL